MADKVENSTNQSNPASDPNMVGKQETQRVRDDRAGKMTPSDEYDQNCEFYGRK